MKGYEIMEKQKFIHTFSVTKNLDIDEFNKVKKISFYINEQKKNVIKDYISRGIRIEIVNRHEKEIKYDKKHKVKKMIIYVNMNQLLRPDEKLGICKVNEIDRAIINMKSIIEEIDKKTGVNIFVDVKLERVDVTVDIITPNDMYSREIIRVAKLARLPYGYHQYHPEENPDTYTEQWDIDNAFFFNNKNADVYAKIYNKHEDPAVKECIEGYLGTENCGMIRCEVSLNRGFLAKNLDIKTNKLSVPALIEILKRIVEESSELIYLKLSGILLTSDMVSKKILYKLIQMHYTGHNKKIEKMINYIEYVNSKGYNDITKYASNSRILNLERYFAEIGVSPIYSRKECPYIPSFRNLLGGDINYILLNKCKRYNERRGHEYVYWE